MTDFLIYELKLSIYEVIYMRNTQKIFKKIMGDNLSDILRILKNGQKSDSFSTHFKHHFKSTTSRKNLRKYLTFKLVNQINMVSTMKTFTKPNCNLCLEERLIILKKMCEKRVTAMNNNLYMYGALWNKTTFHILFLSTGYPI